MSVSVAALPGEVRHPFGLPMGSVRGFISLLICSFFWLIILWPEGVAARAMLAHFFMLGLVLMAFASHPGVRDREATAALPWALRVLFVGGSALVLGYGLLKDPVQLQKRLTPDVIEFEQWWIPFMACMAGGFAFGLFLRFVLGRTNHVFQTIRAWLSVVGILMLVVELAIFLGFTQATNKPDEFLRYWQCVELVVIAGYFGTRA